MLCCLLIYDTAGNVVATLDHMVVKDETDQVVGLFDFAAIEEAGVEMTEVCVASYPDETGTETVKGAKVWPEWLGPRAHDFTVELEGEPGRKHIAALVHKDSGFRRERADIEGKIARRIEKAKGEPADIRDLVGGPDRPVLLTSGGRNRR